jgi:hypothetical protein
MSLSKALLMEILLSLFWHWWFWWGLLFVCAVSKTCVCLINFLTLLLFFSLLSCMARFSEWSPLLLELL